MIIVIMLYFLYPQGYSLLASTEMHPQIIVDNELNTYFKSAYDHKNPRYDNPEYPDDLFSSYVKDELESAAVFLNELMHLGTKHGCEFGFFLELLDRLPKDHPHRYLKDLMFLSSINDPHLGVVSFLQLAYAIFKPAHIRVLNSFLIRNYTPLFLAYITCLKKINNEQPIVFLRQLFDADETKEKEALFSSLIEHAMRPQDALELIKKNRERYAFFRAVAQKIVAEGLPALVGAQKELTSKETENFDSFVKSMVVDPSHKVVMRL